MTLRIQLLLAILCTGASSLGQTTQSAPDLTTPRGAAKAMQSAIEAGDEAALRESLFAPDDRRKLSDALASVVIASSRLSAAAHERFGASGDPIAGNAFSATDLAAIDSTPIEEQAGTATLDLPGRDRPLAVKRMADGTWRVDLLDFANAGDQHTLRQTEMFQELARALNELALDTRDGRFASIADLKAAIQDRVHGTIAKSMRTPRPASAPATNPTPAGK